MDNTNLNSFLKFGYFLDYKHPNIQFDFSGIDKEKYKNAAESELISVARNLWFKTIDEQFKINEKHVVPLSGGLDSRAILATLLEFTEANNIKTYTFGTPGTYDYEIGKLIGRKAGTDHTRFDLTSYEYGQNDLIDISKRIDHQTLLFLHPPIKEIDQVFNGYNFWSGTIIDVFFGRHTHKKESLSLREAMKNSFVENTFVKSTSLNNVEDSTYFDYIDFDKNAGDFLGYEHVIDLLNRQLKYIAPHVLINGYNYKTLLSNELISFAISIDKKYLKNQYLYKKMFLETFPYLFSLPTKSNHGLPLSANIFYTQLKRAFNFGEREFNKLFFKSLNRNINYIDFETAIRERNDLKKVIYSNLMDLKQRNILPWIDIEKLLKNHLNKAVDHSDALLVLASLEIHLKSGKQL